MISKPILTEETNSVFNFSVSILELKLANTFNAKNLFIDCLMKDPLYPLLDKDSIDVC